MRTRHKMIAAAGTVGLAGLVGAVVAAPAMTAAAVSAASSAATGRAEVIAECVGRAGQRTARSPRSRPTRSPKPSTSSCPRGARRSRRARSPRCRSARPRHCCGGARAYPEELHEQLRGGATLAEIAEEQGVDIDDLVTALVAAAEEDLAAAVEAGRLDQERADEIAGDLEDRIRTFVEEGLPPPPDGRRFGGPGPWGDRDRADEDGTEPGTEEQNDASTATPSAV